MTYRFRLRLASKQDRLFAFSSPEQDFDLDPSITVILAARNAETLDKATTFHMDAGGFSTVQEARVAAEALRVRLRLLNAILGLGLNVPTGDSVSGRVSDALKNNLKREYDSVAVDSVWGVSIFPDDGRHFEYVPGGNLLVRPSDPSYVLTALKTLWNLEVSLDAPSDVALHILGLATLETSDKAAFLTYYLALEQLIKRDVRGAVAQKLIQRFQAQTAKAARCKRAPLDANEARSLRGALAALTEESFSSALTRFARGIKTPTEIKGQTPRRFFSACMAARNRIAHNAEPNTKVPLADLATGLRECVLAIIWNRNNLPPVSVSTPPSSISIPPGDLTIRVL